MKFSTPSRNAGQIVTVSYAVTSEGIFKRTFDSCDRSAITEFAPWDKFPSEYEPSGSLTEDPPEPSGGWRIVTIAR